MRPSSIVNVLKHLVPRRRPVFIWGPPGVGKSDVVGQTADMLDRNLLDVRLNLFDPVDLKGFPVADHETRTMRFYAPDFLPPMYVRADSVPGCKFAKGTAAKGSAMIPNPSKGILFLDELTSADRATQAAAYQLMLNFRIGEYVLPEGWAIVAAGNRTGDRSVVHAMPAALSNRLVHLDFDVNLDDFSAWGMKNGLKTEMLAFLRFRSALLHDFKPADNPRAFPSPRSWMFVNNDIMGSGLSAADELETIKGTVGEGAAAEFLAFIRIARDLPTVDEILLNPKGTKVPDSPSALYAISTSLAERASKDNFERLMDYTSRIPKEFQVVFVRDSLRRNDEVTKSRAYTKWAVEHADVLI